MALNFPSSPTNGQVYDNWIYSSAKGAWEAKPLDSAKTITADVAPANPDDGDQWFNTNDGTLYIYVVDLDGGQWVESQAPITANGYYSPNYVINGGFDIWQRGTSLTNSTSYLADRWLVTQNTSGTQCNQSRVTANLPDKLGYALRVQQTSAVTIVEYGARQFIEAQNCNSLAGKNVTLSFWYRSNKVGTHAARISTLTRANGGVSQNLPFTVSTANTWTKYSLTFSSFLGITSWSVSDIDWGALVDVGFRTGGEVGFTSLAANDWFEITGVQLEEGSVATTFRRSGNTIQEELANCQRYYLRWSGGTGGNVAPISGFIAYNTADGFCSVMFPTAMRIPPTSLSFSSINPGDGIASYGAFTNMVLTNSGQAVSPNSALITGTGSSGMTASRPYHLYIGSAGHLALSAEL
jgi:hypothetical protein